MGQMSAICIVGVSWDGACHNRVFPLQATFWQRNEMPLDELVRFWKGKEVQSEMDITEHIEVMRANMEIGRDIAQQNEEREKRAQKHYNDRKVVERKFELGDFVLVFRPTKRTNCFMSGRVCS